MPDNQQDNKPAEVPQDSGPSISFLSFADNRIPTFKEVSSKDWVLFGEDNLFPDHLLYLYNKSSNHGAIVEGKTIYIIGKGIADNKIVNDDGETINKVLERFCKDIEIFGGGYLEFVWKANKKTASVKHIPFQSIRKGKDGKKYYYSVNWKTKKKKDDIREIDPFNPNKKTGTQLFAYSEYRPGAGAYPLPGYFAALNDIETDVEISKYNLSIIKNGMFSSKMISFFNGDPGEEGKKKLEKAFKSKFTGSENSGNFMLTFNKNAETAPQVDDLSTTDLDKLFDQLNKTTQAEIFSGHTVTSPMLFGIMEPGKLGGRNELQDAYEIFKNTYINKKQMAIEEIISAIAPYVGIEPGSQLSPVDPIGILLNPIDFKEILPKSWIYEKLGIDPEDYPDDNVSGTTRAVATTLVNDNLKNLTGRQTQNIERIIRRYKTGKISKPMAETLLKSGLGLTETEITTFLDFAAIEVEEEVCEMFETIGTSREEFTVVKSKEYKQQKMLFAEIAGSDAAIVDLIRKDKRITADVIAKVIKEPVEYVEGRIRALVEKKVLTTKSETLGVDTIIEHAVNNETIDVMEPPETASVSVKYSYEPKPGLEPIIETTRPFCKKLINLDRMYSRAEIESISQRVGYSVFDRKGGFWGKKEECRHRWVANVVIKKNK